MFAIISALLNIGVRKEVDIFHQDARIGKLSIFIHWLSKLSTNHIYLAEFQILEQKDRPKALISSSFQITNHVPKRPQRLLVNRH